MLDTLLETKPARTKRMGGTVMSTLVHAAVIAGAIALTRPGVLPATYAPPKDSITIFVPVPPDVRPADKPKHPVTNPQGPQPDGPPMPRVDPTGPATTGPEIDVTPAQPTESVGSGLSPIATDGGSSGLGVPTDAIVDESVVDRAPRIVGRAPEPEYPSSLRQSGTGGRVVVQLAVDTLGRAEMGGLKLVEASDPRFADAVRAVLPRFRFSPGEVRGRKVRTLVQIPFNFTLSR